MTTTAKKRVLEAGGIRLIELLGGKIKVFQ